MLKQIDNPFKRGNHLAPESETDHEVSAKKMKTRHVTLSPAEEFTMREGESEMLPDYFAAILCSEHFYGRAKVDSHGVLISKKELVGDANAKEGIRYHDPDSIVCNQVGSGVIKKYIYSYNPEKPDMIHLLEEGTWKYIESLPAVEKPGFFDKKALGKAMSGKMRQIGRVTDKLQRVHQADSHKALDDATMNLLEMDRVAETLELDNLEDRPAPAKQETAATRQMIEAEETISVGQREHAQFRADAEEVFDRRQVLHEIDEEELEPAVYDPYA